MHPHPSIRSIELKGALRGIALLSPWCSFRTDYASYSSNACKDTVTAYILNKWAELYVGPAQKHNTSLDYYIEPESAPAEWWAGAKVHHTLLTLGGDDILKDSIAEWAEKFKSSNSNTRIVLGPDECHDYALNSPRLLNHAEQDTARAMKQWMEAVV